MEINSLSNPNTRGNRYNANTNTSFGTLKKVKFSTLFNPSNEYNKKIIDEFYKSEPIKQFFNKYDGIAVFKRDQCFSPVYNSCQVRLRYNDSKLKPKNIFHRLYNKLRGYSKEIVIDGRIWSEFGHPEGKLLKTLKKLTPERLREAEDKNHDWAYISSDSL